LYLAGPDFELAIGSLRIRRGPTDEFTRKVIVVIAVAVGLHLVIFAVGSLVRRRPGGGKNRE
jgi:hypothetical protein